jgi:hypothetical protein
MFRPIGATLQKKQKTLGHQRDVIGEIRAILIQYHPRDIQYDERRSTLTIISSSQAQASELLFALPELRIDLQTKGIPIKRVLVR